MNFIFEFFDYKLQECIEMQITNTLKTRIVVEIAHRMSFLHIMLNSVFNWSIFGVLILDEIQQIELILMQKFWMKFNSENRSYYVE